jgi:tetratricopeptide (TPR) repeat protein
MKEINILWKKYYFDATSKDKQVFEFEYWKQVWSFKEMKRVGSDKIIQEAFSWNVEKILSSQIYYNKWNILGRPWKYEEAIQMYNKSLELEPRFFATYYKKWEALYGLWKYEEAIEMYDKALELESRYSIVYYNKWITLDKLERYEEAIKMYDKTIELDTTDFHAYHNKWVALDSLGRKRESILCIYFWNLIKGGYDWDKNWYEEEKKIIRDYIKNRNFEWLRVYLLGLENEEE